MYLQARKYEEAAKEYVKWLKEEEVIKQLSKGDFDYSESGRDLYSAIVAFLRCPCDDGCKDHVIKIAEREAGLGKAPELIRGNTIYHAAAAIGDEGNLPWYEKLIKLLDQTTAKQLLCAKNLSGRSPIELAVIHNNKGFLKLANDILQGFNAETLGDSRYYAALKDHVDPEIIALVGLDCQYYVE
jgi:hypothetical protein